MTWEKASPELVALFDSALPDDPRVERRKMFGYPCAFANGHMFAGTHEHRFVLRLSENDREAFTAEHGPCPFVPMPGRPMREYVVLPEAVRGDAKSLRSWVRRSLAYAAGLPPKAKTKAKAKLPATSGRKRVK